MMKLRLAGPEHLVDINDLARARLHPRGGRRDPDRRADPPRRPAEVRRCSRAHFPLFADAEEVIADPVVRNRGTIGGSLCQADAAEDLSAVCSAVKADVVIRGSGGRARRGHGRTSTSARTRPRSTTGELLTEVRLKVRPGAGSAHEKVERRAGDWAIAAASAALWIEGRTIADVGHRAQRRRHHHHPPDPRRGAAARADAVGGAVRRGRARSPPRTARRAPTAAGRSTTSAISPACSPPGRCAERPTAQLPGGLHVNVSLTVNGEQVSHDVEPRQLLVHFIRETLDLTGHALGLRHVQLRRLRRAARRQAGEVLHDPHGDGRRARGAHRRVARGRRQARPRAGGLLREPRAAVRVLHARHADDGARAARREPGPDRARDPHRDLRRPSAAARATRTSSRRPAGPPSHQEA